MKIRTCFVSNSSSSSFMVIYRTVEDFDRFSKFEHLPDLLNDLSRSTTEYAFNFVKSLIEMDGYDCYHKYASNYKDVRGISSTFWTIQELVRLSGADDSKYCSWLGDVSLAGFKFYEDHDVANTTYVYDKEWYKEYAAAWTDRREAELEELANELAKDITDGLNAAGYTTACVEYEDHDDYGSYMEHDFMPMLAADADHKVAVFTINNH